MWWQVCYCLVYGGDMFWGGIVVVVNDIEEIGFCLFVNLCCYGVGVQIVFVEGVGKVGVWVCGDVVFGNV